MTLTQVGAYPIERVLGQGGAGAVYLGRDPRSGGPVAIKTLLAGRSASKHLLQRFQAEAQALTRLRHPHLVPLLDAGIDRGVPYLVLEYVEGETLEARLQAQGPLGAEAAVEVIRSLAGAVHYAHVCKVVHRDIKPANVILRPNGEAVLTDFGLALHLDAEGRLSTTGACMGTPGYWSPEQAGGDLQAIGPASDVYGLGALLFACLTGEPPVAVVSLQENLAHTLRGERRPPSSINGAVDPDLDAICSRCMALDPADRYPSAESVAGALAVYLEDRAAGPHRSSPLIGILVGLVVLLSVVAVGLFVMKRNAETATAPTTTPPPPTVAPTTEPLPSPTPPTSPSPSPTPSPTTTPQPTPTPFRTTSPEARREAHKNSQRALVELRRKNFSKAAKLISNAIALDPNSMQYITWIGVRGYCYTEMGAFRDADADLSIYIKAKPKRARPYYDRGMTRYRLQRYREALVDLNRALELQPTLVAACFWRALCRLKQGAKAAEVIPDLERFVRDQKPPHPDLQKAGELLRALKSRR